MNLKTIEKMMAVFLGIMCLSKGFTFGLAAIIIAEVYLSRKTAKSTKN